MLAMREAAQATSVVERHMAIQLHQWQSAPLYILYEGLILNAVVSLRVFCSTKTF